MTEQLRECLGVIQPEAWATTHGLGPFHPAIGTPSGTWYWPNITYDTEGAAADRAKTIIDQVQEAIDGVTKNWNCFKTY